MILRASFEPSKYQKLNSRQPFRLALLFLGPEKSNFTNSARQFLLPKYSIEWIQCKHLIQIKANTHSIGWVSSHNFRYVETMLSTFMCIQRVFCLCILLVFFLLARFIHLIVCICLDFTQRSTVQKMGSVNGLESEFEWRKIIKCVFSCINPFVFWCLKSLNFGSASKFYVQMTDENQWYAKDEITQIIRQSNFGYLAMQQSRSIQSDWKLFVMNAVSSLFICVIHIDWSNFTIYRLYTVKATQTFENIDNSSNSNNENTFGHFIFDSWVSTCCKVVHRFHHLIGNQSFV